jgi:hypothetical protein
VYTGIRQVSEDGSTNAVKTPTVEGNVLEQLLCGNFIGSYSAVMVDSEAIERVGTPDERFPSWQDWEWYLRLAQEGAFLLVPDPLVVRHNAHEQVSSDYETKRDVSYPLLLETGRPIARRVEMEREFEAGTAFELARAAAGNDRFGDARSYVLQSLWKNPWSVPTWMYLILVLAGPLTFYPAQRIKRSAMRASE